MFPYYLVVAVILFGIGFLGVMIRRNLVVVLLCIELMLNSANLVFVAVSNFLATGHGRVFVFFVLTVSAAEVAVGLALVVALYRRFNTVNIDDLSELKW